VADHSAEHASNVASSKADCQLLSLAALLARLGNHILVQPLHDVLKGSCRRRNTSQHRQYSSRVSTGECRTGAALQPPSTGIMRDTGDAKERARILMRADS